MGRPGDEKKKKIGKLVRRSCPGYLMTSKLIKKYSILYTFYRARGKWLEVGRKPKQAMLIKRYLMTTALQWGKLVPKNQN